MRNLRSPQFALLLTVTAALGPAQVPESLQRLLDDAEGRIVRLEPAAFPELSTPIRAELERRGCTIPQSAAPGSDAQAERGNVARGQFAQSGQTDWAVLCSAGGVSAVLVFWNGSPENPAELAPAADRDYLQSSGGNRMVFSRRISAIAPGRILEYARRHGAATPTIGHDGIDDAFLGKASVIRYFDGDQWSQLPGAD